MMSKPPRGEVAGVGRWSGQALLRAAEMASRRLADAPRDTEREAARPGPLSGILAAFFYLAVGLNVQLVHQDLGDLTLETEGQHGKHIGQALLPAADDAGRGRQFPCHQGEEFITDLFSELNFLLFVDALGAVQSLFEEIGEIFDVNVFKLHPVPGCKSMVAALNRFCSG